MNNLLVSDKFKKEEKKLKNILKKYEEMINNNVDLENYGIDDLKENFEALFNFVAVGKVKAGKSSFLNALLGIKKEQEEIFKSGAAPETSKITIVRKGEKDLKSKKDLIIRTENIESLEGIEIIDTPGTDAIIEEHEKITKNFLNKSNLIMFIFDAKNPYTKSEWDLIEELNDNLKKEIIFILQQKDRASEKELKTSKDQIIMQANKKGIENPKIFETSALQEMESKENSGFNELKKYIFEEIGNEDKKRIKLKTIANQIIESIVVNEKIIEKQIIEQENIKKYYEKIKIFFENNDIYIKETLNSMVNSLMNYYNMNLINTSEELKNQYKINKKPKERIMKIIENFKQHNNEMMKEIIDKNLEEIKSEEINKFDNLFNEREIQEKTKNDKTLKMSLKNDVEKYISNFKSLIYRELYTSLDKVFKNIDYKNKNIITKFLLNRKIIKQIENEKIKKGEELYNTLKQQVTTFLKEINTKLKVKLIEDDQKIKKQIVKLDENIKIKNKLDDLKKEINNIDSIIL